MGVPVGPDLRSPRVSAALLIALTAVVYLPTLSYGFVYEDVNDLERLLQPELALLDTNPARMVTVFSLWLSAWISPGAPFGYHLVSVLVHLVNVWLVFLLARRVLPDWGAVVTMGLFALHPIQVEAVAYVANRADLMSTCGVLLALLAASSGFALLSGLAVALACLAKETAIVAWALVPLWAVVTSARFPVRAWLITLGVGLPLAIDAYGLTVTEFFPSVSVEHIARTSASLWRLLLLLPIPLGQSIDHDWWAFGDVTLIVAPLALVSVTLFAIVALIEGWQARWLAFAWLVTILALAPRFVLPVIEGLHEHHLYAVSFAWCLCAGALLTQPRAERTVWTPISP